MVEEAAEPVLVTAGKSAPQVGSSQQPEPCHPRPTGLSLHPVQEAMELKSLAERVQKIELKPVQLARICKWGYDTNACQNLICFTKSHQQIADHLLDFHGYTSTCKKRNHRCCWSGCSERVPPAQISHHVWAHLLDELAAEPYQSAPQREEDTDDE